MQVRCQRCGWSINLSRDFIAAAVAEADEKKLKHSMVECTKCRHAIKVPVKQMRRFAPRETQEEQVEES